MFQHSADGTDYMIAKCHHDADGPPLRPWFFDLDKSRMFEQYAEHVGASLEDICSTYEKLDLEGRLAILVPSEEFAEALRPCLREVLGVIGGRHQRRFKLVSAEEAASRVERSPGECEELVLDTVGNFDGMERLMVVAVGLDARTGTNSLLLGGGMCVFELVRGGVGG